MNQDAGAPQEPQSEPFDESEVARVFDAYLADLEVGRPVDPDRLLANHPEIADQLRACLEVMNLANQVVNGSASVPPEPSLAVDGSTSGSSRSTSLMTTLDLDLDPAGMPQVLLREPSDEPEPLTKPRSTEMPHDGAGPSRYQLQGEIARGGMGAILKGRDVDLGRDLAIKVLLEAHRGNPQITRRFVEEAQIGGQLQHPGIVPVYDLGTFPDRRPFFAMKLVKGQTLAALLADRNRSGPAYKPEAQASESGAKSSLARQPGNGQTEATASVALQPCDTGPTDLPRFLSIFEAVCQTIAYAHARRVIHRDLKPANVMVGRFGEVQVMDWGLAKVLPEGGVADEERARAVEQESLIETVRSGPAGSGSESQAGRVLGTPSYMAPEQARGEVDHIDERSEVFGLGAILCEILTGKPPYTGSSRGAIRAKAERADLADALQRLDACAADAELIALARDCLAAERERRPKDATAVADRVGAYLGGLQKRLRAAELARVEAQTRAIEERKRRRLTVALAASVLVTAAVLGGSWTYLSRQRERRAVQVDLAVREAEVLRDEAVRAGDDLARWTVARNAAQSAAWLAADVRDGGTEVRLVTLIHDVEKAVQSAQDDQKLLGKLVDIRSAKADDLDGSLSDAAYADAFREAEIDLDALSAAEAGARVKARPLGIGTALVAAIDDWAVQRRRSRAQPQEAWTRLVAAARAADPEPLPDRLRDLWSKRDRKGQLEQLRELPKEADLDTWPVETLRLVSDSLIESGDENAAARLLRRVQAVHPSDVSVNLRLGMLLDKLSRRDEAIRFYTAARAIQPATAHELAHALAARGEGDAAIAVFRDLRRLRPGDPRHLGCLGRELRDRGFVRESDEALQAAVAAGREQVRLKPGAAHAHVSLGNALRWCGDSGQAIAEFRDAVRLKPDTALAHCGLAAALADQGRHDEAVSELRTAIRLGPDGAPFHRNLGLALSKLGKHDEAIGELRATCRLKPDDSDGFNHLAVALMESGQMHEAVTALRTAICINPQNVPAHDNLGAVFVNMGQNVEAVAEYKQAIALNPNYSRAHWGLANALRALGYFNEAIDHCRTAIRLKPDDPGGYNNLGAALLDIRKCGQAIPEFRTAIRLRPDSPDAQFNLGLALLRQGKYMEAMETFRWGLRLSSRRPDLRRKLASLLTVSEKLSGLSHRLPAILRNEDQPRDIPSE
jgi:serine/threonine-protein kinase